MNSNSNTPRRTAPGRHASRVLVVADWRVDPDAVVSACARHDRRQDSAFALVVPAWLHGLDWMGDPTASVPCAQRQAEAVSSLGHDAGLSLSVAGVGEPDVVAAVGDAIADWPADELLLFSRGPRLGIGHPLDLTHRIQRLSGLPVAHVAGPTATGPRTPRSWLHPFHGHCPAGRPTPA